MQGAKLPNLLGVLNAIEREEAGHRALIDRLESPRMRVAAIPTRTGICYFDILT